MGKFIQIHLLTNYGPSNLNRDDLGRPKTATIGGVQRLRVSSQSLKRAWRTSEIFESALAGHIGTRTKGIGRKVYEDLVKKGVSEKNAEDWAAAIAGVFGKCKKNGFEIEQLAHFSPEEIAGIDALVAKLTKGKLAPTEEDLKLLTKNHTAADISMFGRMLADNPWANTEAAVQVAHAFTVHKAAIEDDYFSAVDDLNSQEEHSGSGHIGETEFGAGLFYLYICIDRDLLTDNLGGNQSLVEKAIRALVETAATVSPSGKQNSYASRAYASYILAEKTDKQPRSLAVAFLKPVHGDDVLTNAVDALRETRDRFGKAYGCEDIPSEEMDTVKPSGTLEKLIEFCVQS
ncbi:MAG TPA: type I-E CRISPR-associated protein Cas7/Cse4/CasC [Smithellaceae bacterium]|nr:type I-E CRISPR-associated protein Cas7/Cse4/CasC [Smithellaceae bacterium]